MTLGRSSLIRVARAPPSQRRRRLLPRRRAVSRVQHRPVAVLAVRAILRAATDLLGGVPCWKLLPERIVGANAL